MTVRELPPLAAYVHLPWCVSKCPYCDFNSHTLKAGTSLDEYVAALAADIAAEAAFAVERPIDTVFIGGGTPSVFSPAQIETVLGHLCTRLNLVADAEITMEANPGTVERGSLEAYREAGVNRLSLGVQSFHADSLARLGRVHGPDEAVAACEEARLAGFDSVNVDLMFALPGQTQSMGLEDVRQALALGVQHISYYQLTLEPNTVFHTRPPSGLPDDEAADTLQVASLELLRAQGFERYEISALARPGHACRHNLNYWTFGDYLGIGAGAHGKLTDSMGGIWRTTKVAHPASYLKEASSGGPVRSASPVAAADAGFEFMLNALRLPGGFSLGQFSARSGLAPGALLPELRKAEAEGLMLSFGEDGWRPSSLGLRFLNDLQARFLPATAADDRGRAEGAAAF